jgi:hypothetical protein
MYGVNNTVFGKDGRILFFGLSHFKEAIVNGDSCFICGASPLERSFNNEHIIPSWIINRFGLHAKAINLPNGTSIKYSQYKVPCCEDCNSELGEIYERPISGILSKPYREIMKGLDTETVHFIFRWLCLVFLKTHLKDKALLMNRDTRRGTQYLGDTHNWDEFQHIHCMARSHYTEADIDKKVYGSIFLLPVIVVGNSTAFDYMDTEIGKVVMLQLGEFCIIAVLDDACAGYSIYRETFQKINGPLTPFQVRQIVAELNFINLNLKQRPLFHSKFTKTGYKITASIPKMAILQDEQDRIASSGLFLRQFVAGMIGEQENKDSLLQEIEAGKRNYLFDETGKFIKHSV